MAKYDNRFVIKNDDGEYMEFVTRNGKRQKPQIIRKDENTKKIILSTSIGFAVIILYFLTMISIDIIHSDEKSLSNHVLFSLVSVILFLAVFMVINLKEIRR